MCKLRVAAHRVRKLIDRAILGTALSSKFDELLNMTPYDDTRAIQLWSEIESELVVKGFVSDPHLNHIISTSRGQDGD